MVHIRIQNGKGIPDCVASHVVTSTTAYVASQMRPCSGRVPVMSVVGVGTLPPKDLSGNTLSKLPIAAPFCIVSPICYFANSFLGQTPQQT